jgi:uncharacterized membrane protein
MLQIVHCPVYNPSVRTAERTYFEQVFLRGPSDSYVQQWKTYSKYVPSAVLAITTCNNERPVYNPSVRTAERTYFEQVFHCCT